MVKEVNIMTAEAFAKYLETIDKSNLWLKEGKFIEIYNHWIKHIYKTPIEA